MYIPKYSEVHDPAFLVEFIRQHSFGELICVSAEEPVVNHYPFLVELDAQGNFVLWVHVARNNPQWKMLERSSRCLAIFTGPHSYISPVYYKNSDNVPTWSYTAVHVRASVEVLRDEQRERQLMKNFVAHYEAVNGTQWDYDVPEDFHSRLLKAIVWLKLTPESVEGKFKLSQNREKADYDGVIEEFSRRTSEADRELLRYMRLTTPEKFR
jgi:transcriptional regulator